MKALTLEEMQEIELGLLHVFDAFCKENNIRYFLGFGTLLGAVKYKKFIPWDDDVDVLVPREDYNKLLTLFRDNEKYKLYSFEKNKKFHYPFAKLCDMTTRKEQTVYRNKGVELGVELDIFPIDTWDNDYEKAKREAVKIKKYEKWLKVTKLDKPLPGSSVKRAVWFVIMPMVKIIGGGHFIKKMIKASNQPSQMGSKYAGCKVWPIYSEKGIVPAEVFDGVTMVEFEGHTFPAPQGYHTYLTCLYGDYVQDPPKEKQKTHHAFKAYRL